MVAATLININRGKNDRTISPMEVHPYRRKTTEKRVTRQNIAEVGKMLTSIYGGASEG